MRSVLPILAATASMLALATGAHAQATQETAAAETSVDEGQEVVVTGSRGLPRTVTDSPVAIDVIGNAELERTGRAGVFQAMNTLVPSFNLPARAGGSTSTVIATGGLRGLNPDQTLILVNGKRRHKTSLINAVSSLYNGSVPSDLDMIPASAIDHIEVLRDGAAAQYGSDAIAGVINIILKKNATGGFVSGTAGQNFDRSDGETYQFLGSVGFKVGAEGFLTVSGSAKQQEASNRANPIGFPTSTSDTTRRLYPLVNGQFDPREFTVDRLVTTNYGSMPQKQFVLAYNGGYDFGGVEFYSFGTFSQRRSDLNVTFREPKGAGNIPAIYPNGFRPREVISEDDFEFAAGLRGEMGDWRWDLSSTYGKNRARLESDQTLNPSLGLTSPTEFYLGTLESTEWVNSLDVTRGFEVGGGNLQLSGGVQHRRETYAIKAGEPASYAAGNFIVPAGQTSAGTPAAPGAQGASGIQNTDAGRLSRNNLAAYLELTWDPSENLTIGAAGRFEHYDDASGDSVIGKATIRYAPTEWVAIRGSVNTGFRAPALAQRLYASTTGQFRLIGNPAVTTLLAIKTLPVDSAAARALGGEPLTPEKSTSFSAGLVLTPVSNLNVTVDGYWIDLKDRIAVTGTLTGNAISAILAANGEPTTTSAQYYTNAIDTRTRGIDVVASYRADLGSAGQMRLSAGYNYNQTDITRIAPNPAQLSVLGAGFVRFDRVTQGNLTTLVPRTKVFFGNVWTLSDFTLSGRLVRYGGYTISQLLPENDRYFGPKWITDLELGWQATENFNIAVGANNLFNVYPDANGIVNQSLGSQQYGGSAPSSFGFTGGSYYARATVTF